MCESGGGDGRRIHDVWRDGPSVEGGATEEDKDNHAYPTSHFQGTCCVDRIKGASWRVARNQSRGRGCDAGGEERSYMVGSVARRVRAESRWGF